MKRVAFIGVKGLPSQAGADRVVEAIVSHLDTEKFEPSVYCSRRVVPKDVTLPGITLIRMWALPGKHLHATSLFLFSALHALFFGRFDLVHLHNVEASFVLPLLRIRYSVISTSHGAAQQREKWGSGAQRLIEMTEYPYVYLSNIVTCVSQPISVEYQQKYGREVHYLPNGVEEQEALDLAAARDLLSRNEVEPYKYVMFAAGRIMTSKGCHLLLDALRHIDTDLKTIVVGDTSHMPSYEAELKDLADERVVFIPFIGDKALLMGLVKLSRVFVFPSTFEAMSMMLLEAASLGTPLVCSDIPANTAVLDNTQALFFASGDARDLEEKLRWALTHPQQMAQLAGHAQEWVHGTYRWDKIVRDYEALYIAV